MTAMRLVLIALVAACGPASPPAEDAPHEARVVNLRGAGATFPALLYRRWIAEYGAAHPDQEIVYEASGSSAGARALAAGRVDFAASEAPPDHESAGALTGTINIPMTLGAVVIAYNVPGVPAGLRVGPGELASIFLGEIRRWDDLRLRRLNPDLPLPALPISVVHRQDGSGTTAVFSRYLARVSPVFQERVGSGSRVAFPVGASAPGNEGVAGRIKLTRGAVGYVQLAHARRLDLTTADLRNRAGRFVRPSLQSVLAAAAGQGAAQAETGLEILDAPGAASYPIAAYSYVVVHASSSDPARTRALADFLWWCLHEGQTLAPALDHAPLPRQAVRLAEERVRSMTAAENASDAR